MKAYNRNVFLFREHSKHSTNSRTTETAFSGLFNSSEAHPAVHQSFILLRLLLRIFEEPPLQRPPSPSQLPFPIKASFFSSKDHFHYFELNEFSLNQKLIFFFVFYYSTEVNPVNFCFCWYNFFFYVCNKIILFKLILCRNSGKTTLFSIL